MNLMTLENISKSYSEKILLKDISLGINEGEKIGIIGVNGTGKSTLLKIIAGVEVPDDGTIIKANRVRVEYLPQNPDYNEDFTVLQQVFKGTSSEMKLLLEYEETLTALSNNYNDNLNSKLISLQEKIDALNLWDLESEAKAVLTKLGITNFNQKVKELSGGQRKRVSLASALITPCELLILDEPTNHLDNDTIDYLEEYLNSRRGSLIMITHDRYFLDRVSNRIIELDKGRLFSYDGNYSTFLEKKMERLALEASMEEKRQNLIRKELAWVKRGAKARTTKQKARLQRFDELVNKDTYTPDEKMDISVGSTRDPGCITFPEQQLRGFMTSVRLCQERKLDPEIWCFLRELMHLQGRSAMWGFMLEALGCCIVVRLLAMRTLLLLTGTAICMLLEGWQLFRNEAAKNEICADLPGQFMDM